MKAILLNAIPLKQLTKQFYLKQTKFRVSEINGIENYFYQEIN